MAAMAGSCMMIVVIMAMMGLVWFAGAYPVEDLIESLPGQPRIGFRHFGGYVDVDVKNGRSLFYYFVEAVHEPHKKPLALWLNGGFMRIRTVTIKMMSLDSNSDHFAPRPTEYSLGQCDIISSLERHGLFSGPGCSSIGGGGFTELGPFYPTGDGRGLRRNSMSWNRAANILFVESPAGVGWSYSNTSSDYTTGDAQTASDMHVFLVNWFLKFPEYKSNHFFLTGESYAGHYIPQLAVLLLEHNKYSKDFKFNLKGIAIGNPLLRLGPDTQATYEYFWSHGMISDEVGLTIMSDCQFDDYTWDGNHNESKSCTDALNEANNIVGDYINNYDVILDVCYPDIVEQELRLRKSATKISIGVDVCMTYERRFYFNLPEVQQALHANRTNLPYPWSMCSDVLNYSETDPDIDILPALKEIIQAGVPVWVFSGDQDSVVPLLGSRSLVRELAEELNFTTTVPYGAWYHKGQVGGWTIQYGEMLTFATVRGASHMVPFAQPSRALHLFSDFVRGRQLPSTMQPSI